MLAVVGKAGGRTVKGASPSSRAEWERYFANDLPAEFVVKPTLGAHGKGFRPYRRDAADFSAPVLHLTKSTEWDNFVIQRRIRSHSEIVQLTGSEALQTARPPPGAGTYSAAWVGWNPSTKLPHRSTPLMLIT